MGQTYEALLGRKTVHFQALGINLQGKEARLWQALGRWHCASPPQPLCSWAQCREGDRQVNRGGAPQGKETDFDPCFHSNTPPLATETADVEPPQPGLPSTPRGQATQGLGTSSLTQVWRPSPCQDYKNIFLHFLLIFMFHYYVSIIVRYWTSHSYYKGTDWQICLQKNKKYLHGERPLEQSWGN